MARCLEVDVDVENIVTAIIIVVVVGVATATTADQLQQSGQHLANRSNAQGLRN